MKLYVVGYETYSYTKPALIEIEVIKSRPKTYLVKGCRATGHLNVVTKNHCSIKTSKREAKKAYLEKCEANLASAQRARDEAAAKLHEAIEFVL